MKKKKGGVSLDEVYAGSENDPRWKPAYEKADLEVGVAVKIAQARERSGMTQRQLADAIGTRQSVVSRIESANQNLTLETLGKISKALGSSLKIEFPVLGQNDWTGHSVVADRDAGKTKRLKKIPKFKNEDEEREFWATHSSTDYVDWSKARLVTFPNLRPSTTTISLRLPESMINELKMLANKKDVPYQLLMKIFISDRINAELRRSPMTRETGKRRG